MQDSRCATDALADVLDQLAGVIGSLTFDQYVQRPPAFAGSCIGTHVRHCLDHVAALLSAAESGTLDYDSRQRGTQVETDPVLALLTLKRLATALADLPAHAKRRALTLRAVVSAAEAAVEIPSNMERELAYVVSHTTHHNAIVAFLVRAVGGATPEHFGYAASTISHLMETRCAR